MSDRTPSEKTWSDLESQLSAMDHAQLVRICAHLIRTYVVEGTHATAPAAPVRSTVTEQESADARPATPARPATSSPFGSDTPAAKTADEEPSIETHREKDSGYNKLEMD